MKKLILVVALILVSDFIRAQKIAVTESTMSTSDGDKNAFEVLIPKCSTDAIEKSVEKWLKKHDGDVSSKKGEIKSLRVLFKEFYKIPVTVYSRAESSGDDVKLKVSVDAGSGFQSIKSQPDVYQKFQDAVKALAVAEAKDAAQKRLDDAQKQLNKLNGELSDLKKDKDNLQKEIDDCHATIEKNKQSIQTNDVKQNTKTTELDGQSQKVKDLQIELTGIQ